MKRGNYHRQEIGGQTAMVHPKKSNPSPSSLQLPIIFRSFKKKKKRSLLNILRVVARSLLMDPFVSSWTNPTPCLVFRCSVFRLIQIRTPSLIIRLSFPTCSRLEAKGCTHWLNLYDCYQPRCSKHHCCRQLFLAPTRFFFVVKILFVCVLFFKSSIKV